MLTWRNWAARVTEKIEKIAQTVCHRINADWIERWVGPKLAIDCDAFEPGGPDVQQNLGLAPQLELAFRFKQPNRVSGGQFSDAIAFDEPASNVGRRPLGCCAMASSSG